MPRTYKPRDWPYKARDARDGAAVEIAAALKEAVVLAEKEPDADRLRRIARALYHLENALRHLESAGAQTRPVTPEL